jgi:hypothetical protein
MAMHSGVAPHSPPVEPESDPPVELSVDEPVSGPSVDAPVSGPSVGEAEPDPAPDAVVELLDP